MQNLSQSAQAHWYLIHTKPREEACAEENLRAQGYQVYVPMLKTAKRRRGKWVDVIEPLFPRYAFLRLTAYEDNFAPIRSTRGVSRWVKFGEKPATVPDEIIDAIRASQQANGGAYIERTKTFKKGERVEIIEGALSGVQGIIHCDSGEDRVILLLNMLGRETATKVPRDSLVLTED